MKKQHLAAVLLLGIGGLAACGDGTGSASSAVTNADTVGHFGDDALRVPGEFPVPPELAESFAPEWELRTGWVRPYVAHEPKSTTVVAPATERLRIPSGEVTLTGMLHLPAQATAAPPHPAAILIPGSGPSRNLPGIAEHLAARGVAVLDLNKRGVGGSTGRWDRHGFDGRADDVLAALAALRTRPDIDGARIGVIGHSQGGWIAQLAAARSPDVAFVVLLAGPGQTVWDQILTDERIHVERRGDDEEQVGRHIANVGRLLRLASVIAPVCRALRVAYLCHIIDYDPTPALERIRVPVLALFAELDPMVPPDPNVALVRDALERAGNRDVTTHVFTGANHHFWPARTGLRDEYDELEHVYVPGFLEMLGDWIVERTGAQ